MISFSELFLIIWAIAATAMAYYYRNEEMKAKMAVIAILDDENMRNDLLKRHEAFKQKIMKNR